MSYLLNLAYLLLLALASPWLVSRAVRQGKYRQGWAEKFLGLVPRRDPTRACAWLHAVSLGEVALIAPLVDELQRRHPNWDLVISTTTRTGYEAATKRYAGHTVCYAPLDFSWAVRRAMARVQPRLLILAELELWPNLIVAARRGGARVAIVNGRLSERSFRGYHRFRLLVRRLLTRIDLIAAQNALYAERFVALGAVPGAVHDTGSLKFDGAQTDRDNSKTKQLRELANFGTGDIVFLAGSTQAPEEQLAIDAFRQLAGQFPQLRLVLAPRHPERFAEVADLLDAAGLAWQRRSELDDSPRNAQARILLIDRIGELAAWWGTAAIAYVGGSMGSRQGQNMIEPAAYGAAVSFGPQTRNFRDVVAMLLENEAAAVVRDGVELTDFVRRALADPQFATGLGQRARRVVASNLGAASRTADLLDTLVESAQKPAGNRRSAA